MKKKNVFAAFAVLLAASAPLIAQNAPNGGQTFFYKQTEVVTNGNRTAGDNSGQFIAFTKQGYCYDSNKNGQSVNNGSLKYMNQNPQGLHVYEGDTYWGNAAYYFNSDFTRLNVRTANGITYVYVKETPPANALTSAKIKVAPRQQEQGTTIVTGTDWNNGGTVTGNTGTQWSRTETTQPPPDHSAELRHLQERYTRLKNQKAESQRQLDDTYVRVIDSGLAQSYFNSRNSIRETIREYERQMRDVENEARRLGGSVY
jgi:hypothetical protein